MDAAVRPVLEDVELSSTRVLRNALTVDVEEYFQVAAFERTISARALGARRVARRVQHRSRARPVRRARRAGHVLRAWLDRRASPGPGAPHRGRRPRAGEPRLRPHADPPVHAEQFRADVVETKAILEDIGGVQVRGYRAPSYSINGKNLWALDVLQETGHVYSSSIYPIRHDLYGMPEAPRFPFRFRPDGILEIPVTTVALAGRNYPVRRRRLLPAAAVPACSAGCCSGSTTLDRQSGLFYFHPWEVDPAQPRVAGRAAQVAVPALPESRLDARAARAAARGFQLGTHG